MNRAAPIRRTLFKRKGSIYQRKATVKRDPTDALISKVVLLRDPICRFQFVCRGNRSKEAAHIFGRGKFSVRWEEDNVFGACWMCHQWADAHTTEKEEWVRKTLGSERFNRLLVRSQLTAKQCGVDPVAVRIVLRARVKELQGR